MVKGLVISTNGNCDPVNVVKSKSGFTLNKKTLHVHFENENENIMILSATSVDDMMKSNCILSDFVLPSPLNYYIYPQNFIVLKGTSKKIMDLSADEFIIKCHDYKANMNTIEETLTVYDVPLDERIYEDDESIIDEDDINYQSEYEDIEDDDEEDLEADDDEPNLNI